MACRELLTYRPAICCCHCSYVTACLRSGLSGVQLCRIWNWYQSFALSCRYNRCEWQVWRNKQLEIQIQNHRFDYSLQSLGELQIWIQTSQLQPAIKQTYLYNGLNPNYIWISFISGKVWRHIWLEIFKHHLIFANSIFQKKKKGKKKNRMLKT